MNQPIALDIDGSLQGLEGTQTIDLSDWQEAIRFGCSWSTWKRFRSFLNERLPDRYGPVCMGSGDFHHISHLLLDRICHSEPFDVVVLDNHPDNMRFPFGIHCGLAACLGKSPVADFSGKDSLLDNRCEHALGQLLWTCQKDRIFQKCPGAHRPIYC